jgi:hypothetical protein
MVAGEIVSLAVEGPTDTEVLARIFDWLGIELGTVYGERGKGYLDARILAWNTAAKFAPWVVVRDLDHDAPCASELVQRLLPNPSAFMRFRVSVRAIDAWLLADRERIASFLAIAPKGVPSDPDALPDPKRKIIELARRSRKRELRLDLVPQLGMTSKVGPAFVSRMIEFVRQHWRPQIAAHRSPSLRRCIAALEAWGR